VLAGELVAALVIVLGIVILARRADQLTVNPRPVPQAQSGMRVEMG
jgi:hypothetical protein